MWLSKLNCDDMKMRRAGLRNWCRYYCLPPAPEDAVYSFENVVSLRNRMERDSTAYIKKGNTEISPSHALKIFSTVSRLQCYVR